MEYNRKKILLVSGSLIMLLAIFSYIRVYEPISVDSFFVNFTKRIAAESGSLLTKVYDPYKTKRIDTLLGPVVNKNLESQKANLKDLYIVINEDPLREYLKIIKYENKPLIASMFKFSYQPYNEKKLEILKKEYKLLDITHPAKNEFEKILLIMGWVNSRWKIGFPHNVSYNFDALDILRRARNGEQFFCSEYVTTYIQLLSSLGITARYVGLFKGHAISEVWSDDFDKWIVMDPTYNIYYEENGVPLNALELHNAWVSNNWKNIKVISKNSNNEISYYQFKLIDYYENFFVSMRNDWFTNVYPRWHPISNSIMNSIEWSDGYTKNDIRVAKESNREQDLYWPLNHVYIKLTDYNILENTISLKLYLDTVTPNFDKFFIKLDDKEEINTVEPVFNWRLHKGLNTLEVASFNKFGIKGPPTIISMDYINPKISNEGSSK